MIFVLYEGRRPTHCIQHDSIEISSKKGFNNGDRVDILFMKLSESSFVIYGGQGVLPLLSSLLLYFILKIMFNFQYLFKRKSDQSISIHSL